MWGARCGGSLGDCPVWKEMLPCGSTLGCGAGDTSRVSSGLFTLSGGMGEFCCCGLSLIGGVTCGGADMLKISASCFRAAVCLLPNAVSGLVGAGLRRAWVSSTAACVAPYVDEIIGTVTVAGENSMVSETC